MELNSLHGKFLIIEGDMHVAELYDIPVFVVVLK